ncbi:MAG TPA: hypothetical protein VGX25_10290 [Actinophytocola sp.]|uniref:hypothetical protein n=1 Tax=Actinophytocola sp. TaxID=1872138 RepID=UPI002DDD9C18|nr:hypothetical protein [Actinophytocola sp.]HEV2779774.1 hypothetical protein [Actinophytocola sp.]
MTDAMTRAARERDRADRYHQQLCRVAYLIGFYGARAGHTENPDLADLVRQLDEITQDQR